MFFFTGLRYSAFQLHTKSVWLQPVIDWPFVSLDRFSDQEIDDMLHGAPVDSKGLFDYVKFTRIIKHGKDDD